MASMRGNNAATAAADIHLQNLLYEKYMNANTSSRQAAQANKSVHSVVNGLPPVIYDAERLGVLNQYNMALNMPQYNLAATNGYESMPIHTWTRQQLEEQLMALKQREMAWLQGPPEWFAGQMPTRHSFSEVDGLEDVPTPTSMHSRMTSFEASGALSKRHASNEHHRHNHRKRGNVYSKGDSHQKTAHYSMLSGIPNKYISLEEQQSKPPSSKNRKNSKGATKCDNLLEVSHLEIPLYRTETKFISTDEGSQVSTIPSDVDSEFEFNDRPADHSKNRIVRRQPSQLRKCGTAVEPSGVTRAHDWKVAKLAKAKLVEEEKRNFLQSLSDKLKQDYLNFTKNGILSNDLRQEYIRRSKLYPKVRGVWFNSTVRRMGWVGQAYKKCKRIEKIFSISKHGFNGARELAIAFRNSQKPSDGNSGTNEDGVLPTDTTYSGCNNDDFAGVETVEPEQPEIADEIYAPECEVVLEVPSDKADEDLVKPRRGDNDTNKQPFQYKAYDEYPVVEDLDATSHVEMTGENPLVDMITNYTSELSPDEKAHRDYMCKEALRFMLYELSVLMEMDVPVPRTTRDECRRGVQYHIDLLECCNSAEDMAPYMAIFGQYICKGLTPVDIPFNEVYTILRAFAHCRPLDQDFCSSETNSMVDDSEEANLADLIVV